MYLLTDRYKGLHIHLFYIYTDIRFIVFYIKKQQQQQQKTKQIQTQTKVKTTITKSKQTNKQTNKYFHFVKNYEQMGDLLLNVNIDVIDLLIYIQFI